MQLILNTRMLRMTNSLANLWPSTGHTNMKIMWKDKLGMPDCPYVIRWGIKTKWFSIRVHKWLHSDDLRHLHDHSWWYLTFIMKGHYTEFLENDKVDFVTRFQFRYRPLGHKHAVSIDPFKGCWSILLTGPEKREWGFWVNGKFRKRNKYFFEHGHHPCE